MRQSEAAPAWINGILPPLAAAAAFICVGLSVVATRYAVAQRDTLTVAFFRNGLAFVLLFPFLRQQIRRARAIAMEAIMIAESVRQMVDDIDHADITQPTRLLDHISVEHLRSMLLDGFGPRLLGCIDLFRRIP